MKWNKGYVPLIPFVPPVVISKYKDTFFGLSFVDFVENLISFLVIFTVVKLWSHSFAGTRTGLKMEIRGAKSQLGSDLRVIPCHIIEITA